MGELKQELIHNAVRNEHHAFFKLGEREFPIKDLDYDSYLEFVDLARPIVEAIASSLQVEQKTREDGTPDFDLSVDPSSFDWKLLIKLAGNELPRLAWLCCKQSDPKIGIKDVKDLARRPYALLEVVLVQVKHNELIKEFAEFFPRLGTIMGEMAPEMKTLQTPQ